MRPFAAAVLALSLPVVAACSDGVPLGGPYGGVSSEVSPNAGNESPNADDGGAPPRDGAASVEASSPIQDAARDASHVAQEAGGGGAGGTSPPPAVPTWTSIFNKYLANGTALGCADSAEKLGCHSIFMPTPSAAYSWLQSYGQIDGVNSLSIITWYGGTMPPANNWVVPMNTQAMDDIRAWGAAGAKNN